MDHTYVMTAIDYSNQNDPYGNIIGIIPHKVILRDPWPGGNNSSKKEFSWNEFTSRCNMTIKVWGTRY